jgi:hypothetical protein
MKHPHYSLIAAVALAICGLPSLSLAATADTQPTEAKATNKAARPAIDVGMTADQVRAIAGEPIRIKPLKKDGMSAEIWVYKFDKLTSVKDIPTRINQVPYTDPITGVERSIPEPVYSQQRTFTVETTELLMVNGALTGAKRYHTREKSID